MVFAAHLPKTPFWCSPRVGHFHTFKSPPCGCSMNHPAPLWGICGFSKKNEKCQGRADKHTWH